MANSWDLWLTLYIVFVFFSKFRATLCVRYLNNRLCGYALGNVSQELTGDKEVVMKAVKQCRRALQYASEELKGDREVVREAVKQNRDALQYASKELKGVMRKRKSSKVLKKERRRAEGRKTKRNKLKDDKRQAMRTKMFAMRKRRARGTWSGL